MARSMTNREALEAKIAAAWMLTKKDGTLYFECNLPVLPAVRQNRYSRWGPNGQRAQAYNAARAAIRDLLTIAMKQQGFEPFPKDARLSVGIHIEVGNFWVEIMQTDKLKPPKGYLKGDWDNLAKMVMDSCQGVAFANDSQIDSAFVEVKR